MTMCRASRIRAGVPIVAAPTVASSDLPETSPLVRTHRFVVVLLFSLFVFAGCQDDTASPDDLGTSSDVADVAQDPAVAEILAILRDYQIRSIVSGIDGHAVLDALASDDPHALSRRIGYTDDEIAARDARMRVALDDLRSRFEPDDFGHGSGDGGASFAAWIDSDPSLSLERAPVYIICEMNGLMRDVGNCFSSTGPMTDGMYTCIFEAICNNCTGLEGIC